ncbi:arsenate reductase ArsC [Terriglobus sp.]|uniref:arsenate reductase ArsC n=1 Tax=Terriglobus sp. TaxID=1889013 RepID=UPI003B003285
MQTYIFACVHNAGRSQMAAAFFNQLADPQKARAVSAGTEPGPRVHPVVLEVMQEVGLDLSAAQPQLLTEKLARDATMLVTMGCGENCPYVPGLCCEDWPLPDPKSLPLEEVRKVRDEVKHHVVDLIRREHLA